MASNFILNAQLRVLAPTAANVNSVLSQIQGAVRNVNSTVNVTVRTNTLNRVNTQINQVRKSVDKAKDSFVKFGEQAALASKRFAAFTTVTAGVYVLGSAFRSAVKDSVEFDKQLVRVAQVTKLPLDNLKSLTDEIDRLSIRFGVNSQELIKSSVVLSQSGLSIDKVRIAIEALAKSDLAPTFTSIEDTAEASVAIFSQFNIQASELEGKLGSLNAVAAQFAVESDDLATTIRRSGGAFKAAGGNIEELIALFTSVRSTTRESAESIATGFRTIFTRLQRVRTIDFLGQLGIDLLNDENQFVGPLRAIEELSNALNRIQGTDPRFSQIIEELGGFRQVSKVIPLIQQFDVTQRALNVALQGSGSLTRDAVVAQQSLANQFAKVREEFDAMVRSFSNNEALRDLVTLVLNASSGVIKLAAGLEKITPLLLQIGGIGLVKTLVPFAKGFSGRGFNSGGVVPGFGNSDTVPAMLTPGEFVLTKEAVKKIGTRRLERVNKVAGFNKGGLVGGIQHFARGGIVNSVGGSNAAALGLLVLPGVLDQLVDKFIKLGDNSDAVSDLFGSLTQAGGQLLLARSLSGGLIQNRADSIKGRISELENIFGDRKAKVNNRASKQIGDLDEVIERIKISDLSDRAKSKGIRRVDIQKARVETSRQYKIGNLDNELNARLAAQRDNIKILRQAEQGLNKFNVAVTAVSLGLDVLGDAIRRNSTSPEGRAFGSALSSAGSTGANVGFLSSTVATSAITAGAVTGPVGLAIAGVVTGLAALTSGISSYSSQLLEEKEKIAQSRLGDIFTDLQRRVTDVSQSNSSIFSNSSNIRSGVGQLRNRFVEAQGSGRGVVEGQIQTILPELTTMAQVVAKDVKSFQELESVLGGDVLKFLYDFGSIPASELNNSLQNTIISANKERVATEEVTKSLLRASERVRDLNVINKLVTDLESKFSLLDSELSNFSNQLSSVSGNFQVFSRGDLISNFQSVGDFSQFGRTISKSLSFLDNSIRKSGSQLSGEVTDIARAASVLPDILLSVANQDPFGVSGGLLDRLGDELAKANIPKFIRDEIINTADFSIIGPEGDTNKLLKEIANDLPGTSNKLLNGFTDIVSTINNFNSLIDTQLGRFSDGLNARNQAELRSVEEINKISGIFQNADQKLTSLIGAFPDASTIGRDFDRTFSNFAGNRRQDPNALRNEILFRQTRNRGLEQQFNNAEGEARKGIIERIKAEELQIEKLNSALNLLANDSLSTASSLARLEETNRNAAGVRRITDTATFGSNDQIKQLFNGFRLTQAAIARPGFFGQNFGNENLRQTIGQFLGSQDQNTVLPGLGGLSIREIQEQLSREAANASAGGNTQQAQAFQQIIDTAFNQGGAESRARQAFIDAVNKSAQAQANISSIITQNASTFEQALQNQWTQFISELRRTFNQNQQDNIRNQINTSRGSISTGAVRLNTARGIQSRLGLDPRSDKELNSLIDFVNSGSVDKFLEQRNTLTGFSNLGRFSGEIGRVGRSRVSGINEFFGGSQLFNPNNALQNSGDITNQSFKKVLDAINSVGSFNNLPGTGINEAQQEARRSFLDNIVPVLKDAFGEVTGGQLSNTVLSRDFSLTNNKVTPSSILQSVRDAIPSVLQSEAGVRQANISLAQQAGVNTNQLNSVINDGNLQKALESLKGGIDTKQLEESNDSLRKQIDSLNQKLNEYTQAINSQPKELTVNGTQSVNVNITGNVGQLEPLMQKIANDAALNTVAKYNELNNPGGRVPRSDQINTRNN